MHTSIQISHLDFVSVSVALKPETKMIRCQSSQADRNAVIETRRRYLPSSERTTYECIESRQGANDERRDQLRRKCGHRNQVETSTTYRRAKVASTRDQHGRRNLARCHLSINNLIQNQDFGRRKI